MSLALARTLIKSNVKSLLAKTGKAKNAIGDIGARQVFSPGSALDNVLLGSASTALSMIPGIGTALTFLMIGGSLIDMLNPSIQEMTNSELASIKQQYFDILADVTREFGHPKPRKLEMFPVPLDMTDSKDLAQYASFLVDYMTQNNLVFEEDAVAAIDALSRVRSQQRLGRLNDLLRIVDMTSDTYISKVHETIKTVQRRRRVESYVPYVIGVSSCLALVTLCILALIALSSNS